MTWIVSGFADEAADDPKVQLQTIRDAGLKYIDPRGVGGENIADCSQEKTEQFRQLLDDAGVTAYMMGTPIGKIDIADDVQTDIARLERVAANGRILNCNRVRIFSYYNRNGASSADWREITFKRFKALKERAADMGLVLYNENEHKLYGEKCAQMLELAEEFCDDSFKMIFDFDNYNQIGEDVWENWVKLRECTDAFHLKDSDRKCQHVPFGTGNGKAKEILSDAKQRGWQGSLSLEPHLAHSPAVMATGPSGEANQTLADLSDVECWLVGARSSHDLLKAIGAEYE